MLKWLPVTLCDPPHSVSRPNQVVDLANDFHETGWYGPALVGYPLNGRIQLLTGSHRYAAARLSEKDQLPVYLVSLAEVEAFWGNVGQWKRILNSAPHVIAGFPGKHFVDRKAIPR